MSGNRSALRRAFVPVLAVLALCLLPGVAQAEKATTDVHIDVEPAGGGQYEYTVKVSSDKRKCRKHRTVIVWHDENRNGNLDKDEYIIGEGKTNRRGKLVIQSTALPPAGDFVGVYVRSTDECKAFEQSFYFTGFPD